MSLFHTLVEKIYILGIAMMTTLTYFLCIPTEARKNSSVRMPVDVLNTQTYDYSDYDFDNPYQELRARIEKLQS